MFVTYLRRELRRRMRQAIFIAWPGPGHRPGHHRRRRLGRGLGDAVHVLHSLYGVGTDVTVSQPPAAGSGGGPHFRIGGGSGSQPKSGTSFNRDVLIGAGLGTLKSSSVTTVAGLKDVSATAGALALSDVQLSARSRPADRGRRPGGWIGGGSSSIKSSSFSVTGWTWPLALGPLSPGPLPRAKLQRGRLHRQRGRRRLELRQVAEPEDRVDVQRRR